MMTFWGLAGTGGKRSMITLRGGGGTRLPAMTIRFGWTLGGGGGGASRMTRGLGVSGRGGCWRMMTGGAAW